MARGLTKFRVTVPLSLNAVDKRLIGENIIRRIQTRTGNHTDIDGNRFASYSKAYREQKRDYGLSGSPNLRLTGEMLNSLQILQVGSTFIEIGYQTTSFEARKAVWNQGGNSSIPSRPFLGILDNQAQGEVNKVVDNSPIVDALRFIEENTFDDVTPSISSVSEFVGESDGEL